MSKWDESYEPGYGMWPGIHYQKGEDMSKQARELAELMGWKPITDNPNISSYQWIRPDQTFAYEIPDYPNDLNAMREVWKVLHERGLWHAFMDTCFGDDFAILPAFDIDKAVYIFLNDLPGQVEAAIKVLREGGE